MTGRRVVASRLVATSRPAPGAEGTLVLVCGMGLMGHGIAQVLAAAGYRVRCYEPNPARAEAGIARIAGNLARGVEKGRLDEPERLAILGRVEVAASPEAGAAGITLAVEAVLEDEQVKRELLARLDTSAPGEAFLASNTSSIPIERLAEAVTPTRRPRVVGMHFFSPVPIMPLVELVRGPDTSDATEAAIRTVADRLGKQVIVSQDRPGFIVNRMLMPFLAEAMRALEEGLATAEDIDAGARLGLSHPMGPLELADFIGLDVCLDVMEVLHRGFGDPRFEPPERLRRLVAAGHLGRKSGQGFHAYSR